MKGSSYPTVRQWAADGTCQGKTTFSTGTTTSYKYNTESNEIEEVENYVDTSMTVSTHNLPLSNKFEK